MTTLTGGASGPDRHPPSGPGCRWRLFSAVLAIALAAFFQDQQIRPPVHRAEGRRAGRQGDGHQRDPRQDDCLPAQRCADELLRRFCTPSICPMWIPPASAGKKSADWVIMVFFGGVNSLTGSTLGAFILSALPQALRGLQSTALRHLRRAGAADFEL